MKILKNYNTFIFESAIEMVEIFNDADILESIVTDSDSLLKSIKAQEVDLHQTFNISLDDLKNKYNIEELYDNNIFNEALTKMKLKKNELESTEESETFIEETIIIKFFSIFDKDSSELEKPKYIIYQSRKKSEKEWGNVKCYSVNDDMKNFYDKLTNKTVEIRNGEDVYIYSTSNSGNDWVLQKNKLKQETDKFKEYLTSEEIKNLLLDKKVSITIIS
ncbi:hypothetical protein M0Q97_05130 [Candidatus Dojkabacteria bacterium]|jgi:hypothetical protein|nr:hypothetical protein [Candidatus Dojkabacteria bacterium]